MKHWTSTAYSKTGYSFIYTFDCIPKRVQQDFRGAQVLHEGISKVVPEHRKELVRQDHVGIDVAVQALVGQAYGSGESLPKHVAPWCVVPALQVGLYP